MSTHPTVCAVVLTLNEQGNIERCLDALGWCEDTVVVDSGSTDDTQKLAGDHGARVLVHEQAPPFQISEQRNWALEHAGITTDWVLFVDADEIVTATLAQEIRSAVHRNDVDAFQLAPKYLFRGRWMKRCTGYPNWHDRILRRDRVRFAGGVWEHFAPGTRCDRLTAPYLHFGDSKGLSDWLGRHQRYAAWESDSIVAYLGGGGSAAFRTSRRQRVRSWGARLWFLRPLLRFHTMYVLRRGFLDGPGALAFCLRYAVYEWMIVEFVKEKLRESGELSRSSE